MNMMADDKRNGVGRRRTDRWRFFRHEDVAIALVLFLVLGLVACFFSGCGYLVNPKYGHFGEVGR